MKMKLLVIAVALAGTSASASDALIARQPTVNNNEKAGQFGVGLAIGGLTGLATQYWLTNDRAINANFAAERGNVAVSAAHLWLFRGAFGDATAEANYFVPYIGAGAIASFGTQSDYFTRNNNNAAVAAQVPLGIEFLPSAQRFGIFAEADPSIEISPVLDGFVTALVGARFYF